MANGQPAKTTWEIFAILEEKLNALEAEHEYLLEMCPVDKRDNYKPALMVTLVRLILDNLPKEYDATVKYVRNLYK